MNSTEISIIIPVYNSEKTINECIKSLQDQTFVNFEIILVNDGSTDKSGDICNDLKVKDSRIKVIHKENGGLGSARSAGFNASKSPYVYFMDADDTIEHKLLEDNLKIIKEFNADVVVFGFVKRIETSKGVNTLITIPPKLLLKNESDFKLSLASLFNSGCGFSIWNQLIKSAFIRNNHISFYNYKRGSDMIFLLDLYSRKPILITNSNTYYNFNANYSVNKYNPEAIENHILFFKKYICLFENWLLIETNRQFSVKLFLLWFSHVIPNGIVLNSQFSFYDKIKEIKKMFIQNEFLTWLKKYRLSDCKTLTIKMMLLVLKTRNAFLLFLFTKTKIFIKRNFKFNYKRIIFSGASNK